jgi:HAD superfamily hydrolase (TIGR01509 family)
MIDTVISDLGQVLVLFDNRIFFDRMAAITGRPADEIRRVTHQNRNLVDRFDTGRLTPEEFHRLAVAALGVKVGFADFFAAYNDVFSLNRPALAALAKLKPKYKLGLVSNTDPMRYGYLERRFPELLIFDAYVLSFRTGVMKPNPAIYREALSRTRARPHQALFIDDLPENIAGAERLGICGLLFKPEIDLETELRNAGVEP